MRIQRAETFVLGSEPGEHAPSKSWELDAALGGLRRCWRRLGAMSSVVLVSTAAFAAPSALANTTGPSCAAGTCTQTFDATGDAPQSFTVPTGVSTLSVQVAGAEGGNAYGPSDAPGGETDATLSVTPGEVLTLVVGDKGSLLNGGYGGGGGSPSSAGGGGGSFLSDASSLLLAAGGGGGNGDDNNGGAGAGAGQTAANGSDYTGLPGSAGRGASSSQGGAPGCAYNVLCGGSGGGPATSTSPGVGGAGVYGTAGGGGGGGYYGGGGGSYAGGGGGSGYADPTASQVTGTVGGNAGPGFVTFTYAVPPVSTTAPMLTGNAAVGQTLSVTPGSWANGPVTYAYQWQDCDSAGVSCADIAGATASSYMLTSADGGYTVRAIVTATNGVGSAAAASNPSAYIPASTTPTGAGRPVNEVAPTIAGTPAIGQLLEASVGGWSGSHLAYGYQWLRDGVAIPGASGASYRVSLADSGRELSIEVVASDGTTSVAAVSQPLMALSIDVRGCTAPSGRLTAGAVGGVRLGMTRRGARRLVASTQRLNGYTDNLCLAGGYGIRVGYGNTTMLGHGALRRALSSRIVFATTANPYYSLDGARPGTKVVSVAKRLHLGRAMHIGPNTWYVIPGSKANHVLKVRAGVIQEIGVLNPTLTSTRARQGLLLRLF